MIIEINSAFVELPYSIEELTIPEESFRYKEYMISPLNWFGLSENERSQMLKMYGIEYPEPEEVYEFYAVKYTKDNSCSVYVYECNFMDQHDYWREVIETGIQQTIGKGGKVHPDSLKAINI